MNARVGFHEATIKKLLLSLPLTLAIKCIKFLALIDYSTEKRMITQNDYFFFSYFFVGGMVLLGTLHTAIIIAVVKKRKLNHKMSWTSTSSPHTCNQENQHVCMVDFNIMTTMQSNITQ